MDRESLQRLLDILHAGKDLYSQIQRNFFVSDSGIAETLCRHSKQFIGALFLVVWENIWPNCMAENIVPREVAKGSALGGVYAIFT